MGVPLVSTKSMATRMVITITQTAKKRKVKGCREAKQCYDISGCLWLPLARCGLVGGLIDWLMERCLETLEVVSPVATSMRHEVSAGRWQQAYLEGAEHGQEGLRNDGAEQQVAEGGDGQACAARLQGSNFRRVQPGQGAVAGSICRGRTVVFRG